MDITSIVSFGVVLTLIILTQSSYAVKYSFTERYPIRKITRNEAGVISTYIIEDGGFYFFESKAWCDDLGGSMPIIHTQEDFDFLMDKVLVKHSPGYSSQAWLGMKPVSFTSECKNWLDDSLINFKFPRGQGSDYLCDECKNRECCAMIIDSEPSTFNFGRIAYEGCNFSHRRICVIQGEFKDENNKLNPSYINNIVIESKNGGIIGAVVASAVISTLVTSLVMFLLAKKFNRN